MNTNCKTSTVTIRGMTCGHCVNAVTDAISKLDGVTRVEVDLATGVATVDSDQPLDRAALAGAVDEAGYELVS